MKVQSNILEDMISISLQKSSEERIKMCQNKQYSTNQASRGHVKYLTPPLLQLIGDTPLESYLMKMLVDNPSSSTTPPTS